MSPSLSPRTFTTWTGYLSSNADPHHSCLPGLDATPRQTGLAASRTSAPAKPPFIDSNARSLNYLHLFNSLDMVSHSHAWPCIQLRCYCGCAASRGSARRRQTPKKIPTRSIHASRSDRSSQILTGIGKDYQTPSRSTGVPEIASFMGLHQGSRRLSGFKTLDGFWDWN